MIHNSYSFTLFSKEDILKAIKSLSSNKASPVDGILIKYWKIQLIPTQKNLLTFSMNVWLTASFPTHRKEQMLLRFLKKVTIMKMKTIIPRVSSQLFRKCWKNYYLNKFMIICKVNSQSILQIFTKANALRMLYRLWLKNGKLFWIKKLLVGALFMDLSKAFDALDHSLLLAKIKCVCFW